MELAVLDIVPTYPLLHGVNSEVVTAFYHWFFLVQPSPFPETLIANNVEFYLRYMMFRDMSSTQIPNWVGEDASPSISVVVVTRARFMRIVRIIARTLQSIWNTTKKI
jgi:hypothetical protein